MPSRKHYKKVAVMLNGRLCAAHLLYETEPMLEIKYPHFIRLLTLGDVIRALASVYSEENVSFSHEKFYEDCGMDSEGYAKIIG